MFKNFKSFFLSTFYKKFFFKYSQKYVIKKNTER